MDNGVIGGRDASVPASHRLDGVDRQEGRGPAGLEAGPVAKSMTEEKGHE
jgi:hypothetical protein